ncbi:hypothetical protein D4R51_03740 [bacterium]|nr:MAG: hypothetical protein D4R51_03740 [bacterium]
MDEQVKSEISRKLLKLFLRKTMLRDGDYDRELGNVAKELSVTVDNLKAFLRPFYEEIFNEILDKNFSSKKTQG